MLTKNDLHLKSATHLTDLVTDQATWFLSDAATINWLDQLKPAIKLVANHFDSLGVFLLTQGQ